ncbi:alpha-1,2-mannosidase [Capsulimonas corticalis]|uniref:Alpha-1,2-mannosidase n=1 Tax=Capsulimonas corticalis TaxID=2219043 RepID=A0A402D0P0_9BACT|nr:GH92 family glycosyl hydrolase [Capsulimonas corticalis]BDI33545.1 alpha-1,2-mannosidase [Capsulimonas corticalis]
MNRLLSKLVNPSVRCLKCFMFTVIAGVILGFCAPLQAYTLQNLTQYVNPFCGTAGGGNAAFLYPGAVAPFGMVQWSPDTSQNPSGYQYSDTQVHGFSLTHGSGGGCNYGSDFSFMPILGTVNSSPYSSSNYSHLNTSYFANITGGSQHANPGYYSMQFNGITTELTATTRTGFGRFTYPSGNTASMLINLGGDTNGTINASIQINPGGNEISGWTQMSGMCGTAPGIMYFDVVFDHSFSSYGVWNGSTYYANGQTTTGASSGAAFSFNLSGGGVVLAHTALSSVSVANARANLAAESPGSSFNNNGFNAEVTAANNAWNAYLNEIQVSGGSAADTQTFYTMMYRTLLAPNVVSDVNGQYMGFDGSVHTLSGRTQYGWYSGWDIYRNECQFLAMIDPVRASDMAQSLVQDAADCGAMPRWADTFGDGGLMLGDCSTPIIGDMYAFGARSFDTASALADMKRAALTPNVQARNGTYERPNESSFLSLGYVPSGPTQGGYAPVCMTLEYCIDDYALAQFANAIGSTGDYLPSMQRAQNWRNLYNSSTGYIQMRDSNGAWSSGFPTYNGSAFADGDVYQYVWAVPFNLSSLFNSMGGASTALSRLNNFFTQINDSDTSNGQYAFMGNEPCAATPWIYTSLGQPYKASSTVRQIMTQLFNASSNGYPGNDDFGAESSWYVWAALGMYPAIPGSDVLVLHGPLFPQATLNLQHGTITITGSGASDSAPYVQSLSVNGQSSNASWIHFANFVNGGTLSYSMGASANTGWGTSSLPPSDTDGMTVTGIAGTHLIVNHANGLAIDNGSTTTQGAGVIQWGPNGGSAQKWTFTQNSDTSWNIVNQFSGQSLDVPGGSTTNGTQIIQWGANGGDNQRWWVDIQPSGSYKIWNKANSLALDDDNMTGNGSPLIQWTWNGGNNQLWNLQ